jgi:hypothetical protein
VESVVEVTQRSSPFYGRKGKVLGINHQDGTGKKTHISFALLGTKNYHFTKTGSGPT